MEPVSEQLLEEHDLDGICSWKKFLDAPLSLHAFQPTVAMKVCGLVKSRCFAAVTTLCEYRQGWIKFGESWTGNFGRCHGCPHQTRPRPRPSQLGGNNAQGLETVTGQEKITSDVV